MLKHRRVAQARGYGGPLGRRFGKTLIVTLLAAVLPLGCEGEDAPRAERDATDASNPPGSEGIADASMDSGAVAAAGFGRDTGLRPTEVSDIPRQDSAASPIGDAAQGGMRRAEGGSRLDSSARPDAGVGTIDASAGSERAQDGSAAVNTGELTTEGGAADSGTALDAAGNSSMTEDGGKQVIISAADGGPHANTCCYGRGQPICSVLQAGQYVGVLGGDYQILARNSGLVLAAEERGDNVFVASIEGNIAAAAFSYTCFNSQHWRRQTSGQRVSLPGGTSEQDVTYQNYQSLMYLAPESEEAGSNVIQREAPYVWKERTYRIADAAPSAPQLYSAHIAQGGKVIEVAANATEHGANVQLGEFTGAVGQRWGRHVDLAGLDDYR